MPEDKMIEQCRDRCAQAGISFAHAVKEGIMMFPINVRGLISEHDLVVPSSELAMSVGAAGKKLIAWNITDNYAHVVYESEGCCGYTYGLPGEVLSKRIKEITRRILG